MARFICLSFFFQLLAGCTQGQPANRLGHCESPAFDQKVASMLRLDIPAIDVDSVRQSPGRYLLLDARAAREYAVGHIPGARWIDYPAIRTAALAGVDYDQPIAVYCSIGYRSERIARELRKMGYRQAVNVYGSIFEWVNRGYPLSDGSGKPSRSVHGYDRSWSTWVTNTAFQTVTD